MNLSVRILKRPTILLVFSLFLLGAQTGWSQRTISGTVTEAGSDFPLIGATVMVPGTAVGTATDEQGAFTLNVPEGAASVEVSYTGYQAQTLSTQGVTELSVYLRAGTILHELAATG
ncbi:MAG: carboxypeptidase-like regulatory domain-containing protein, partial [Phaeodactylibacter sp.]|nr:carboxypeptidase-like regulatory domain-containing protein [Phaeodactylibacter sp.]